MSNYLVKVYTDDSNVKEWEDLNPDEIHHIEFKGKRYDEVKHGRWDRKYRANFMCSVCKYWVITTDEYGNRIDGDMDDYLYCPNCGSRMDEVEE